MLQRPRLDATLVAITLLGAARVAGALTSCEMRCNAAFDLCWAGPERTACQAEMSRCHSSCGRSGPTPPPAPTVPWGYLVFDTATGRSGASWGWSSGVQARGAARDECRRQGGQRCDWQLPARGGCVAIAEGDGGRGRIAHQKSGGTPALNIARTKAIDDCRREGGQRCRVVAQACSWKV
jgi:Domain of unknown function (DUF4189)